jgi:serine/threonine protein kinase
VRVGDVLRGRELYTVTAMLPTGGRSETAAASGRDTTWFLKRFTSPIYPHDPSQHLADRVESMRQSCLRFEERHLLIMGLLEATPVMGGGNLVRPVDFFRQFGNYYKVYPFVRAEGCRALSGAPGPAQLLFVKTLLLCLRELHAKRVVHGDIKPDNVLVERRAAGPVAKLIDFDDAYVAGDPPPPGRVSGDVAYLSPELVRYMGGGGGADELAPPSDVFSLALLLHELLRGRMPAVDGAGGGSHGEAVLAGGTLRCEPLPELGAGFSDLLATCGARDPRLRPSAEDLLETLGIPRLGPAGDPGVGPATRRDDAPSPNLRINVGRRSHAPRPEEDASR